MFMTKALVLALSSPFRRALEFCFFLLSANSEQRAIVRGGCKLVRRLVPWTVFNEGSSEVCDWVMAMKMKQSRTERKNPAEGGSD